MINLANSRQLQETNQYLENLFNYANAPIIVWNPEFRITRFNHAFENLTGRKSADVVGEPLDILFPPVQVKNSLELIKKTTGGERWESVEIAIAHSDGSVRILLWNSATVFDQDGKTPIAAIAQGQDITERKQAENKLQETNQYLENLFNYANAPIIVWNPEFRITRFNHAFENLTGRKSADVVGEPLDILFPPVQVKNSLELIKKTTGGKRWESVEIAIAHSDGSVRILLWNSATVFDQDGKTPIAAIAQGQDITERKQAEVERLELQEQLLNSQKLESLGVLAGGIAHDFNNILMVIMGNAELVQMDISDDSPAQKMLKSIIMATKKAADLCKQMLAYSGKGTFVIKAIDLSEIVEDMGRIIEVSISKKATLNYNLVRGLPPIEADVSQIQQIIMNLIINASESLEDMNGTINISTGLQYCCNQYLKEFQLHKNIREGSYAYLEVTDTGCGMDKQTLSKLFDPFFSTKFTGRGLGLSAVQGIVRGHKGGIIIKSKPGKGTSFKLFFPIIETGSKSVSLAEEKEKELWISSGGYILLVDDNESIRLLGKILLERIGFDVITASNGREAIEVFLEHKNKIQCILLDLTMPLMDGEEAFHEIRKIDPNISIIMCSGYAENDVVKRFLGQGGQGLTGFIQKPYNIDKLSNKLREIFEKR